VGSEWPSPNGDPCETYTCEAVAGTVQKIQKIQKCDVQCELVFYSDFLSMDMMINGGISCVLIYLMTLYHLYWLLLGFMLDKYPELSGTHPTTCPVNMFLHSPIHPRGIVF
jgi:hypothetical protein